MGRNLKMVKLCSDWQLCSRASGYRGYTVARLCSFPGRGEVLPFWAWAVCPRRVLAIFDPRRLFSCLNVSLSYDSASTVHEYLVLSLDGDAVVAMLC
ncbi:unnamed protein product [Tuber melanosporum]|uniref:(Perigord truffle) hypothetical protein n=1 Tax=Tuber melanosporum (strain Mel28) TaxID=656061 RepID=D5GLX1_TUBMM|nr:uncharacterized protein GSTUM_00010453001 [Tuber melanosporum]CAZ85538.1 unnamed protein product [Tuber melanosporum]